MIALASGSTIAWWVGLGVGLVVALVVAALLEGLRRSVVELEQGVEQVLLSGGHVAQNTWAVQLLDTTKASAGELIAELERHGATARGGEG